MKDNRGFTLIEMMISIVIILIMVLGVHRFFQNYIKISISEKRRAELYGDVKLTLSVIKQDVQMASFGMPPACRVASDNAGGVVIDTALTDRLFLANGWEIIRDFTDNGYEDGTIADAKYANIAEEKGEANISGYSGGLAGTANKGAAAITLTNLNIDAGDGVTEDNDFKQGEALILYDNAGLVVEGHNIGDIAGNNINLAGESLANDYPIDSTLVVPAIDYYINNIDSRYWLCRNGARVLKDVKDFQIRYGYDADRNRSISDSEWVDDLPGPFDSDLLRCIKVEMMVSFEQEGKTSQYNYEIIEEFRN